MLCHQQQWFWRRGCGLPEWIGVSATGDFLSVVDMSDSCWLQMMQQAMNNPEMMSQLMQVHYIIVLRLFQIC